MPERQDLPDTKNGLRGGGVHTDFIQTIIDIWDMTASQSTVCKIAHFAKKWGQKIDIRLIFPNIWELYLATIG